MPESYKYVSLPKGEQKAFLMKALEQLSMKEVVMSCKCTERTIRDWRSEKHPISFRALKILAQKARISLPVDLVIKSRYAHTSKAGKKGANAVLTKYGRIPVDETYRNAQWQKWWETEGKFRRDTILRTKAVHLPARNTALAEFIGIMMGDGGLSPYQMTVTLHHIDDLDYSAFVVTLIRELFHVPPSVYHVPKKSVKNIVLSRKAVPAYLHTLGLPIGNKIKQHLDIPAWIKSDREYAMACVRGLIDTDGSVFTHRYQVKGVWYAYKKLSFTSASAPLLKSMYELLQGFGFHPRKTGTDVRLEKIDDVNRYFSLIGSHNPKHLRRYGNTVG